MRKQLTLLFFVAILSPALFLQSCKKTDNSTSLPSVDSENVYIVCEGNFGNGDGSLYLYQPSKDSVYGDIYNAINHQPLGDVFQNATRIGNNLFLCVNNSDKIVVINDENWNYSGAINVSKPDEILSVGLNKAYVSQLYTNKLTVINTQTLQVTGTITFPYNNTQGMVLYNNKAYICLADSACNKIYVVDVNADKISDSIKLNASEPQEILLDNQQKLWVLSGSPYDGNTPAFSRLDPSTNSVLGTYQFPATADPIRPVFNGAMDTLYFVEADYGGGTANNGIFRMSINDTHVPSLAFIQAPSGGYLYSVGVDPVTGNIFVGDPKGFTQKGTVSVYHTDGTLKRTFTVAVGPGHFYFDVK
jgi:DNA-binding beta-propeller fold protein YncE